MPIFRRNSIISPPGLYSPGLAGFFAGEWNVQREEDCACQKPCIRSYEWIEMIVRLVCLTILISGWSKAAEGIDHEETIRALRDGDAEAGRALYALHCASCHGKEGDLAVNPLARRFAVNELKFGSDPYSLWKTISYGNGLMFRWDGVLTPRERYQVVHHLREEIIRERNPGQYFEPDEAYYEGLNERAAADGIAQGQLENRVQVAPGMIDGSGGTRMRYGPFLQHAVAYGSIQDRNAAQIENTTEKALIVDLPGDQVICYDAARLSVSGIWRGKLADTSETHHTSYKGGRPVMPGGEVLYQDVDRIGWTVDSPEVTDENGWGHLRFKGVHLHGRRVVLGYEVGGREVRELPGVSDGGKVITRALEVGPGTRTVYCLAARDKRLKVGLETLEGAAKVVPGEDGARWIAIAPSSKVTELAVRLSPEDVEQPVGETIPLRSLLGGGPRRWPIELQTAVAPGKPVEGYAADLLRVPFANPYGSWMRISAMDFFKDGRMAVSTLSGDVWVVTAGKGPGGALRWSRFAAGLYEPLGLKVVDELVHVRGRDRITRLHDLNGDGEADYYESFHEDSNEIGASYHAFVYDLQCDEEGNFYYSQSGYKSPLTGAVVKVSPDGKRSSFIGRDLRNPNGLGSIAQGITVADNPSGKAVFNGFMLAREGVRYGFEQERSTPMLVVLPPGVDSSSGGQCQSRERGWGPLGGAVIHTSYSLCSVFYCLIEDAAPYPNGFAIRFPHDLVSGAMRPRVNPVDGQVYVACHKGWDTRAPRDGAIYRLRYTGDSCHAVCGAQVTGEGIRLTFACDLDAKSVIRENIGVGRASNEKKASQGNASPAAAVKLEGKRRILITIPGIAREDLIHRTTRDKESGEVKVRVNLPLEIVVDVVAADGSPIRQTVYATVNSVAVARGGD